jgi:signal transduction histidine kinase
MEQRNLSELSKEELITIINEKNDYLSMIVHQLRSPLTAEKWFLEMIATGHIDTSSSGEGKNTLVQARYNIENAIKLLRELSAANHTCNWKIQFSPKKSNLREILLRSTSVFTGEAMAKHISIITHSHEHLDYNAMVDPDKISIVFENILENALKYSAPGSTVDIRLDYLSDNILVSVTDQGIGIPYDDQKNICTRLYRGSNTVGTPGTGLGMYIAKEIVDYHHGSLWFESIPDIGTTFFVKLPTESS